MSSGLVVPGGIKVIDELAVEEHLDLSGIVDIESVEAEVDVFGCVSEIEGEGDGVFVTFYEYATGNFYLRFKEGVTRETPMSPRLESMKLLIRDDYPKNE